MEPAHFDERALSDLASIEIGRTPSRSNPAYWGGVQKWVTISDFEHGDVVKDTKERISQQALDECGVRVHCAGTLIMSFKLTIGKLAILGASMATNEAIAALKPLDTVLSMNDIFFTTLVRSTLIIWSTVQLRATL
jgi:type I restriction enzyme S subunit